MSLDYATLARIEDHLRRIADALESEQGSPKPPPDTSWVTYTEPRPTRPSPMRPAEGGIGFWLSAVLGGVAFAVFIVLLVGALS